MIPTLNFASALTPTGLASLGQIILGDLTMAGDNVVIMGTIASGLPDKQRRKVLLLGVSIDITVETRDRSHAEAILTALGKDGFALARLNAAGAAA